MSLAPGPDRIRSRRGEDTAEVTGLPHARTRRRTRCAAALALAALALPFGGLAVGQNAAQRKRSVDQKLQRAESRLRDARGREQVLTRQVSAYNTRLRAVEVRLGPLRRRLDGLDAEVARLEARLRGLTVRLTGERRALAAAEDRLVAQRRALTDRLRYIYAQGDVDPLLVVLTSGNITDVVETQALVERIAGQDGALVAETRAHAAEVRRTRDRLARAREEADASRDRAKTAADEIRSVTEELQRRRDELATARAARRRLLSRVVGDRRDIEAETRGLQTRSAALAAMIMKAQTGYSGPTSVVRSASSAGMIWPVNGPLTSGFGYRWGRMHEGVDIGVGTGTPVAAAASGRVITAGWAGGYGNLVVIDHGGGIATAYGHNSKLLVTNGQQVAQGQIVALSGSTGHSTGPHVHFEVRVNGAAVNPVPYL